MEELSQQEGRMRLGTHRIVPAVSLFAPLAMRNLDGIIDCKRANQRAER
ncbi:MAG: hypothetical protein HYZ48_02930, partial [Chlamydiales bacterium]|nr:hypothetical protein [Chlamydiales bacterium]